MGLKILRELEYTEWGKLTKGASIDSLYILKMLPESERTRINQSLSTYLFNLKSSGLIDEKLYQLELMEVNRNKFMHTIPFY